MAGGLGHTRGSDGDEEVRRCAIRNVRENKCARE
jgi:hypothetical protein